MEINNMETELEHKLINTGYRNLFLFHSEEVETAEIWKNGINEKYLKKIITSQKSSKLGRFLAAEFLRSYEVELSTEYDALLSEAYTFALKESNLDSEGYIGINGNSWGFLYDHNSAGYLGKQFLEFGEVAVPYLKELLKLEGAVIYEGSQDATIGNSYQYRIKDFAAFYISKIKNIPIQFYQDIAERDKEIERFKKVLEKS